MSDEEIVRVLFEAFNRHDGAAQKRLASEDVETIPLRAALEGNAYHGHEGIDQFWDEIEESWSEISIDVHRIQQGTEAVFVSGRLQARGRETGAAVEMELGWAVSLRDGKASRMATYTDVEGAMRAAGLKGD